MISRFKKTVIVRLFHNDYKTYMQPQATATNDYFHYCFCFCFVSGFMLTYANWGIIIIAYDMLQNFFYLFCVLHFSAFCLFILSRALLLFIHFHVPSFWRIVNKDWHECTTSATPKIVTYSAAGLELPKAKCWLNMQVAPRFSSLISQKRIHRPQWQMDKKFIFNPDLLIIFFR